MPQKLIVLLIEEKAFKAKLKEIVTDLALHTSPTKLVVDKIWRLLLTLNEEETDGKDI